MNTATTISYILSTLIFTVSVIHCSESDVPGIYLIAGGKVDYYYTNSTEVVDFVNTNSTPSFGQLPEASDLIQIDPALCSKFFPDYFEFLFLTSTILACFTSCSAPFFTFWL